MKMISYVAVCLLLTSCSNQGPDTVVTITNVSADTLFLVKRAQKTSIPFNVTWKVAGTIDDPAVVFLRVPTDTNRLVWLKAPIPSGKSDTLLQRQDFYGKTVEVLYKHQNAKRGKLTITVKDW